MKKYITKIHFFSLAIVLLLGSCSLDLDINDNPNSATGAVITPDLTLATVIASTASSAYSTYGNGFSAFNIGYILPGGGISGYGSTYTYDFTSASVTGAWTDIFGQLRNYQSIINKTEGDKQYSIYYGITHIVKAWSYQLLVDSYGDVPYTEGLQGGTVGNVTPAYDKGADVYKLLVAELDEAIAVLKENKGLIGAGVLGLNKASDPVFSGDATKWIQFANNLKLRLLVRAAGSEIDAFVQSAYGTFSSEGFLKEDIYVNPGYNSGTNQNPIWSGYHSSVTGTVSTAAQYYLPSKFIVAFYDGKKLTDDVRGKLTFKGYPTVVAGLLGDQTGNPNSPMYLWYTGGGTGTAAPASTGIVKSRTASLPIFTAAQTYFLLAEAALTGHALDGDAKTNFVKGITAAFNYLSLEGTTLTPKAGLNPTQDALDYIAANAGNYLADFDAADTQAKKLEAIITQKYLAHNIIDSYEAWTEFRRTSYPTISGTDPVTTFISTQASLSKFPIRLLHPQTERDLNPNTPKIDNAYESPIFWDRN